MQISKHHLLLPIVLLAFFTTRCRAQNAENWTEKQLLEPAALAADISAGKAPLVISVGPGAPIPHSVAVGMTNSEEGLSKLKAQLQNQPKESKIVIYCGCCPFEHCPNVRPAINALKELKFTNYLLLNLPHNIKKDWIDKGYPLEKP